MHRYSLVVALVVLSSDMAISSAWTVTQGVAVPPVVVVLDKPPRLPAVWASCDVMV